MIKKVDHIGIAVKSIESASLLYRCVKSAFDWNRRGGYSKGKSGLLQAGSTKLELLEPTSEESAIAKFIENAVREFTMLPSEWTRSKKEFAK